MEKLSDRLNRLSYSKTFVMTNKAREMKRQGIIEVIKSDFLLDYGPEIQESITDEKLRNWSPWLD